MPASEFVATLRLSYQAEDQVEAELIADSAAELIRTEKLEEEEGDAIVVTQVINTMPAVVPEEMVDVLARARDTLIKTRLQRCVEIAREVDMICFALEQGDIQSLVPYNYGRFMDRLTELLRRQDADPS